MITNPEALIITEVSQQAFIEMFKQYIRDVLGFAYAGLVVQAFRRPWCNDSGPVVHSFR